MWPRSRPLPHPFLEACSHFARSRLVACMTSLSSKLPSLFDVCARENPRLPSLLRDMQSCPGFWMSLFVRANFMQDYRGPNAKLSSLLDVYSVDVLTLLINWNALACPHGLSLFGAYTGTI